MNKRYTSVCAPLRRTYSDRFMGICRYCLPRACAAFKHLFERFSGGTTCLTLLVQRRFSSKVANILANYGDP